MALGTTVTITSQFLNNSTTATTVSKIVTGVVVDNQVVADFRQINPGVINSAYTERPNMGTPVK